MLREESSLLIVKNEPNIDYIAYSSDNNSKIVKYNESEIKLENDNEILHIKQEDLDIKDEIQMAVDNQDESALFTHNIHKFATKQELDQSKKLFACTLCEFKAVSRSQLNSHNKIHSKTTFNCNLCEYKTIHKHALARHIRTHTEGKPHACNLCDFITFAHTGEKPLCPCACSIVCELKYSRKSNLKNHTLTRTQEKLLFVCSMCEFTSSQTSTWIKHQKLHRVKKQPLAPILPRMPVLNYFRKQFNVS